MPDYYFAYGSNMNSARMRARGLAYSHSEPARLANSVLRFNKRAHNKQGVGYANVCYGPGCEVQGVLYELAEGIDIAMMDPYEGTPVRYSRELFEVSVASGSRWAWVYVANSAYIDSSLSVEQAYLDHLLSAGDLLSEDYRQQLQSLAPILASGSQRDDELSLRFNV